MSNDHHNASNDPLTEYLYAQANPPLGDRDMSKKPSLSTKSIVAGVLLFVLLGLIVAGFIGALINVGLLAFLATFAGYAGGFWALYPVSLAIMVGVTGLAMAVKVGVGSVPGITVERV